MILKVKKLNPEAKLPVYAHKGDAGADLFSIEKVIINPGEIKSIHTGIAIALPENHAGLIWDKSGIAANHHIHCLAGVIDESYRGEWKVTLTNLGKEPFVIEKHQKIAQLLVQPIAYTTIKEVSEMDDTERGENAFGSTGLK
jgi:dUTP pyrophosphatase